MKALLFTTQCFLILSFSMCQLNNDQAINSCGMLKDYTQPTKKEDCKPGGHNFECCFVSIPEKKMKYCSYLSGKINDDIITQFKTTLGLPTANIQCNNSSYVSYTVLMTVTLLIFFA